MNIQSRKNVTGDAWRVTSTPSLRAFTLIELLVVIAIISLLAAMVFPITKAVNRTKMQSRARVELAEIENAIKLYKDKIGQYPPDNPTNAAVNPLYYELLGTTNNGLAYITLDGSAQIAPLTIATYFSGATAFANSTQPGGSDETRRASQFLTGLKPGRYGQMTGGPMLLTCSVLWPATLGNQYGVPGLNPFRYSSSGPTNNPSSFDLWVDIVIDGKTNRISNWSAKPLIVN
jgi:prepilin-type N-terminal cleavage/methylation domain-containing protein